MLLVPVHLITVYKVAILHSQPQTHAAAAAKSLQLCPTLCDPIDGSPPGSLIPGILQERTQEWVAISFSLAWKWKVKVTSRSRVHLLATPWTAAYQAPPSMGFSRQEYWSGVPLPSPQTHAIFHKKGRMTQRVERRTHKTEVITRVFSRLWNQIKELKHLSIAVAQWLLYFPFACF